MAPSQLQINTSVLQRLVKEEASYYKEIEQQKTRISKLEKGDSLGDDGGDEESGNREFQLKQERKALEETKAIIPGLREKIANAREKLESVLDTATNEEEREKAMDILVKAKEAQKDDPVG